MADAAFDRDWEEAEGLRLALYAYLGDRDRRDLDAWYHCEQYSVAWRSYMSSARRSPRTALASLFHKLFDGEVRPDKDVTKWRRVFWSLPAEGWPDPVEWRLRDV